MCCVLITNGIHSCFQLFYDLPTALHHGSILQSYFRCINTVVGRHVVLGNSNLLSFQ